MKNGAWPIMVLGVGLLAGAGCAYGEVRQVIRAQFASEFHCSEVQLKKRDTWYANDSPDQYKVIGCGQVRTYTCPASTGLVSYDKPACTWVNGDADAPVVQKVEGDEGAGDEPAAPSAAPAAPGKKPAPAPGGAKPKAGASAPEPEPEPEL